MLCSLLPAMELCNAKTEETKQQFLEEKFMYRVNLAFEEFFPFSWSMSQYFVHFFYH